MSENQGPTPGAGLGQPPEAPAPNEPGQTPTPNEPGQAPTPSEAGQAQRPGGAGQAPMPGEPGRGPMQPPPGVPWAAGPGMVRRRPAPDDRVATRIIRLARRALWIGGGSILLGVFFAPVGILAGAAALTFGIMALRITARYDFKARGAVLGVVLGSVGLAFSLLVTAMTVYLYKEISDYTNCQNGANTISDSNQCKTAFAHSLEKKMHLKRGSINPSSIPS